MRAPKLPASSVIATRLAIFDSLSDEPATIGRIAERSGFDDATVRNHLKDMLQAGVVQLASVAGLPNAAWCRTPTQKQAAVNEHDRVAAWLRKRNLHETAAVSLESDGATLAEVCSAERTKRVSQARQNLWLALELRGLSQSELGRVFKRNSTTVSHGVTAASRRATEGQAAE